VSYVWYGSGFLCCRMELYKTHERYSISKEIYTTKVDDKIGAVVETPLFLILNCAWDLCVIYLWYGSGLVCSRMEFFNTQTRYTIPKETHTKKAKHNCVQPHLFFFLKKKKKKSTELYRPQKYDGNVMRWNCVVPA
jgi:phosphorylcholine metabolism protein LicD